MIDIIHNINQDIHNPQHVTHTAFKTSGSESFFNILDGHLKKEDTLPLQKDENTIRKADDFYKQDDNKLSEENLRPLGPVEDKDTIENRQTEQSDIIQDWEQKNPKDIGKKKLSESKKSNEYDNEIQAVKKEKLAEKKVFNKHFLMGKVSEEEKKFNKSLVSVAGAEKKLNANQIFADKKIQGLHESTVKKNKRDDSLIGDKELLALAENLENLVKHIEKTLKTDVDGKRELDSLQNEIKDFKVNKHDLAKLETVFNKLKKMFDVLEHGEKHDMKTNPQLLNIKELLTSLQKKLDGRSNSEPMNNAIQSSVKELGAQIEALVQNQAKEQFEQPKDKHESGNFSNLLKSESGNNKIFADKMSQQRTVPFKEQLQSIIDNAKVYVKDSKNGHFTLRLFPKNLGSVNVNLGLEQGILHGKFLVETTEARDLLLQNLNNVKDLLGQAGISVGDFQVDVQDRGQEFSNNNEMNDKKSFLSTHNENVSELREYDTNSMSYHNGSVNLVI